MNKSYTDMKNKYHLLLMSGMFFEFYPELSGEWVKNKMEWKKITRKNKVLQQKIQDQTYNQNK